MGVFMFIMSAGLFFICFSLHFVYVRLWCRKIERRFGNALSGEINGEEVKFNESTRSFNMRKVFAAKISNSAVLVYRDKGFAYPFHREMFSSSVEWESFKSLVRESVRDVHEH